MKILITSYAFAPSIGGIETVTMLMAEKFIENGHLVKIITNTLADTTWKDMFEVYRRPSAIKFLELTRWADVVWQNGISLNYLWGALLLGKPKVVTLAGPIYLNYPLKTLKEKLKAVALRFCRVMAISRYVLNDSQVSFDLVGNPFDTGSMVARGRSRGKLKELVFVGRLVSDKGADLLIQAVGRLVADGREVSCTIIGDGPERSALEQMVSQLSLAERVQFMGYRKSPELYGLISQHEIMVVPSRWKEPFGIVALEGVACGCIVVGSNGGGLPLAIGPCGLTFENDNLDELVACLEKIIDNSELRDRLRKNADDYLQRFDLDVQAKHYMAVFRAMIDHQTPPNYGPLIVYR